MKGQWQNWSGSVHFTPSRIAYPTSEAEIVRLVKECRAQNRGLRVVGTGHSFTPLVQTDGMLISLDRYTGVETVDRDACQATVRAGTKIKALGEALFDHGLAQPNLGDIDVQSIAGAISTGTHGSGIGLGSISTQVIGLTLITASGDVVECSEENNRDLFKAAQVSFGSLGIISKVQLQLVPAYTLHYVWKKASLHDCLANYEKYAHENRNFEFFWMPYTDSVQAKFMNVTDKPVSRTSLTRRFNETVLENGALWLLSEYSRRVPRQAPAVSKIIGALVSGGSAINYSHRVFATQRLVRFQEMEYSIPVEHFATVLREIDACIRREHFQVHFPIECRFVRGDDIPLSPASGRDSAYIAVHMYKGMAYKAYFAAIEAIFARYGGRPHWGKMHTRTAADFAVLYPQWAEVQAIRQKYDPDGFFLNAHLRTILGDSAVEQASPETQGATQSAPITQTG